MEKRPPDGVAQRVKEFAPSATHHREFVFLQARNQDAGKVVKRVISITISKL
jgi:hypothetical protein